MPSAVCTLSIFARSKKKYLLETFPFHRNNCRKMGHMTTWTEIVDPCIRCGKNVTKSGSHFSTNFVPNIKFDMDLYGWIFVALDSLLNSNLVYKNLLTKVFNNARKVCAKTTRWKLTSEMTRKEIITTVSLILNRRLVDMFTYSCFLCSKCYIFI